MGGQVVHDDGITLAEGRDQPAVDLDLERRTVHRSIKNHGGGHAAQAQGACEGRRLPMAVRDRGAAALTARSLPAQPSHFGRSNGLINEDQSLGTGGVLVCEPDFATSSDVGPFLLGSVCGLF